jgi:RNA polymerase sigma-70 factor (ECF subfamily)
LGTAYYIVNSKEKRQIDDRMTAAHKEFQKGLNARAFFKTNNHATGQDLVQDTFMKTWKYLVKGGKIDIMKAFLYHILNHLIIDEYRKHKTTSLEILIDKGFEPSTDNHESLVDILDGKMAIVLIKLLPAEYQKIMHMKYVQDLSLKEMSLITGLSKNTIAVKAHRGLEKLKILYHPR